MLASGLIMVRHHSKDEAGCQFTTSAPGLKRALIARFAGARSKRRAKKGKVGKKKRQEQASKESAKKAK